MVSANHLLTLHCRYVHVCVVYASVIFKFSQGQAGRQVDVLYDRDEQKTSQRSPCEARPMKADADVTLLITCWINAVLSF